MPEEEIASIQTVGAIEGTASALDEPAPAEQEVVAEVETEPEPDPEPETYSADYVKKLRDEAATHRVKAKRTDVANARLVAAFAETDGRLAAADDLPYSDDLLDDDGIVSQDKVAEAISGLLAAKPHLGSRRPTAPLPQGVREDVPDSPGLFTLARRVL